MLRAWVCSSNCYGGAHLVMIGLVSIDFGSRYMRSARKKLFYIMIWWASTFFASKQTEKI